MHARKLVNKLFVTSLTWALVLALTITCQAHGASVHDGNRESTQNPVRTWNELALDTARVKLLSDAQAARLYAMVNVAMYDAVNGIVSKRDDAQARTHAIVPYGGRNPRGDIYAAASAAAHAVLSGEFPDQASRYDVQLQSDLATYGGNVSDGRAWGAEVGALVRAARTGDGSTPNESQPAGSGPGQFRASWSGIQFRNLRPFGISDSSIYVGDGPPALGNIDYAATFAASRIIGDADNIDNSKLATYQYWSLGTGTSQPPGAWIQIALAVTTAEPLPLPEMARLFALVSMAMADTVAPTVMTKFIYRHWRPATAIREADADGNTLTDPDGTWAPRAGGIGSSPEYWSGHSSFSAAGATALAGYFCADNRSFSLVTDSAPANASRTYPGFSAAAAEAGSSRVVGGIHFEFSNQEGLAAGRAIAGEILAKKLLRRSGPTHIGECPLGSPNGDEDQD